MVARIPLLSAESELSDEQRRVVDAITSRRGGRIPGPYRLSLHCPEFTQLWHPIGELLRLKSSFPLRLSELAIITTARAWDCDYIFQAHSAAARQGGIGEPIIAAIARGERPRIEDAEEAAVYAFCTELLERHGVSDETYARATQLFGTPRVVELTGLIGYYGMVAAMLLAHGMPLPEGVEPPLAKRGR